MQRKAIEYIPSSHLDLFWLGSFRTCLERGAEVIKGYLDRCLATEEETFLLETVVFAEYFLERHPEYLAPVRELVAAGRLEVGAAFIDRWETLVLAESHVRNIVIGQRWCREVLGADARTAAHPDLPSLVPQIAQIYRQAGVRYYATSRKVFEHGQVWRHRAPDGTTLLVLNYPRIYLFTILDPADVPAELLPRLHATSLDLERTQAGFPRGVVAVPGSAGDLADRRNFRRSHGRYLEEFVGQYREQYPEFDFGYTIPSRLLSEYEAEPGLPELAGEIPSVWGVAADEEAAFFRRDRRLEATLLTAETLAAAACHLGVDWRPAGTEAWQGTFHDAAFFGRKDLVTPGEELAELWRMHVFTQDHNGGGQEGVLSSFQKRVIQERCQEYAEAIFDSSLKGLGAGLEAADAGLLVFNPHGRAWSGTLTLPPGTLPAGHVPVDPGGGPVPMQVLATGEEALRLSEVPPVGYRFYPFQRQEVNDDPAGPAPVQVERSRRLLLLRSQALELAVDLRSGNLVRLLDLERGVEWGHAGLGALSSVEECGNDTALRIGPGAVVLRESLLGVEPTGTGPLCRQVEVRKRLAGCDVLQTLTLWGHEARLDLRTRILWWGKRNQQVRMGLPTVAVKGAIVYGSPFFAVAWDETVAGAAPRRPDEIAPEDYDRYREVQGWLHLRGAGGGITICSDNPGVHHDGSLEAVLLRTPPSCGDPRLYWENAGEQVFDFCFIPGDGDWREADAPRLATARFRPPVARAVPSGGGTLPTSDSLLAIEGAQVSAIYPGADSASTMVRFYETAGRSGEARLTGPLCDGPAALVDLLEDTLPEQEALTGKPGDWRVDLPAWRIVTVRLDAVTSDV
jgi:alpha-mannosidase